MLTVGLQREELISDVEPDWSREHKAFFSWDPARSLLASIRAYQRCSRYPTPVAWVLKRICVLRHRFWSVVTGADIPLNCNIQGGLQIPHPNGIVIHPQVKIGPNCLLFQQVTLGALDGRVPILEGHVDVGAGAKVLGGITLGRHSKIGANAVVITDVPAGATAVGIPARIRGPQHEPAVLAPAADNVIQLRVDASDTG